MAAKTIKKSITKHPQSVIDVSVDRTEWLEGKTILSSTWNIPSPLIDNGNIFTPEGISTTWIGGGILDVKYEIKNIVTTTGGITDVRCINIIITNNC